LIEAMAACLPDSRQPGKIEAIFAQSLEYAEHSIFEGLGRNSLLAGFA
jgi:hypothetical protein